MMRRGLPLVIAMPGAVYGPGDHGDLAQPSGPTCGEGCRWLPPGPPSAGPTWRMWLPASWGPWSTAEPGETYILGGPAHRLLEVLGRAGQLAGKRPAPLPLPWWALLPAAWAAQGLALAVPPLRGAAERLRLGAGTTQLGSDAKARAELGFARSPTGGGPARHGALHPAGRCSPLPEPPGRCRRGLRRLPSGRRPQPLPSPAGGRGRRPPPRLKGAGMEPTVAPRDRLTLEEAGRRAEQVSNIAYILDLDLQAGSKVFHGDVAITFDHAGGDTFLEWLGGRIDRFVVNGVEAEPDWDGGAHRPARGAAGRPQRDPRRLRAGLRPHRRGLPPVLRPRGRGASTSTPSSSRTRPTVSSPASTSPT